MIKSCKPGLQITTSEEIKRHIEHLTRPAGSRILLALFLYLTGVLILKNNKDTPLCICDGIKFRVWPCDNVRQLQDLKLKLA